MKRITILNIILTMLFITVATSSFADPITIKITAEVAYVDDIGNTLDGAIEVGDIIIGQYTYESMTLDTNPLPIVGDYQHDTSPYGISLEVNGLIFATDPEDVQFLVEIVNDHYYQGGWDNYLLRSYNNLPLPGGIIVEHISWQLDDPTATALSSDTLPTAPPVLEDWQSVFGLTITGSDPDDPFGFGYFIRAHVTSAVLAVLDEVVEVAVDIKPQSCPNPLNVKSRGVLPVATLGTEDFDVSTIDPASIRLAGVAPIRSSVEDVSTPVEDSQDVCDCATQGADGYTDLTLKFDTQEIVSALGEVADGDVLVLTLTGKSFDGIPIEGKDCIVVLSKGGQ